MSSVTEREGEHDFTLDCETCVREVFDQVSATSRWCADRPQDADEIAASALERIVESVERGTGWRSGGNGTLQTWAATVTRNAAIDAYRKRRRRVRHEADLAHGRGPAVPDALEEVEYVRTIETYLEGIKPTEAMAVRLAIYEEYTPTELAEALGCTPQWWGRVVKKHTGRIAQHILEFP